MHVVGFLSARPQGTITLRGGVLTASESSWSAANLSLAFDPAAAGGFSGRFLRGAAWTDPVGDLPEPGNDDSG